MAEGIPPPEVKTEHTPGEWRAALREMVAAHEHSKNENDNEDWKEGYFAKRSNELDGEAQKLGLEGVFRSLGEKYNKLGWKSKLAVGLGLGVGTALFSSASLPAAIACMSGIAIQRIAGMASMFLKFEKNSHEEKWGKEKAMGKAVLYTAGMTAGMLVLIAGVKEGIDFANQHDFGNATQEWLKQHWPFGEVDISPSKTHSEAVSPLPSTETATATPEVSQVVPAAPDESALALEKAQAVTDKAFADVKETLAEAQKLVSEQQVEIDKTVDDYGNNNLQIEDETVPSNARGLEELKAEVNADLAEHQELNDALNKIEADKFTKLENPDFKADAKLTAEIQADLDKNVPEQSDVGADASGGEQVEENPGTPGGGGVNPEAPFGRDANGHPFPSEQEAKDYEDLIHKGIRDPRETGAWPPGPPKEKDVMEKLSDWFNGNQDTTGAGNPHFETNAVGLAVDTAHANAYLDVQGNHIIFGGSLEDRAQKALELVAKDHSAVAYFDSTRPGGLFGWFQEHHLSKAYWTNSPEGIGAQQPVIVDDVTDATLRGVNLPSIDDLKEPYKPVNK